MRAALKALQLLWLVWLRHPEHQLSDAYSITKQEDPNMSSCLPAVPKPGKSGNNQCRVSNGEDVPSSKQKLEHSSTTSSAEQHTSEMERLLAKLSPKPQSILEKTTKDTIAETLERQVSLERQELLHGRVNTPSAVQGEDDGSSGASLRTPATEPFTVPSSADMTKRDHERVDTIEMLRLKQELLAANSRIALQEQELAQTRVIKHTLDQALGPPSEADFNGRDITEQTLSNLQSAFNASTRSVSQRPESWVGQDDSRSDISDALSAGAYNRTRGFWTTPQQVFGANLPASNDKNYREFPSMPGNSGAQEHSRDWDSNVGTPCHPGQGPYQAHRVLSGPSSNAGFSFDGRYSGEQTVYLQSPNLGPRRSFTQVNRGGSCFPPQNSPWGTFPAGVPNNIGSRPAPNQHIGAYQQVGMFPVLPYQPRPIGTPLSPTAAEFTSANGNVAPWAGSAVGTNSSQTYISPLEPLNYRRLLDKNVSCDWKYIVDKIVCGNDQQASIFLQQKLKVGTAEQKYEIIEAIVSQAYPLMVNRFGNFLVQRCFEHGTPEQVVAIANAIRGNTLSLSMDPFGCHVIQKAFDCVPEEHKAVMVHELLRRIPETVIHRYACHVWQKLFELRWSNEPPQIMAKVNEALRGMWHEVALGETGSLVVQNIFENCVEDEKRPAIEEVLAKIDLLSHGQFGNWCIQHICEHGAPHDKSRAIEHILLWATDYSMDQFASKVVEKCLKIGGSEFLDRYLARVCTGRPDRPRMPLIDIAGDQYGNYLIQWILMNAAPHQRELVATHIRKHMVSLRGSKFGSRVAMLCCNPSHTTRPGPGAGVQLSRFGNPNDERYPVASQIGGRFNRGRLPSAKVLPWLMNAKAQTNQSHRLNFTPVYYYVVISLKMVTF
ncbi:hypothetical protein DTO207G8_1386 [Paecilomyces variotii]|nr:hypothetical protein DTO207G8_1386 [Paecilomyces variotii]KAJ9385516.1 hypothetical protein DTO063F5_4109 [Paecilomyces variotii]